MTLDWAQGGDNSRNFVLVGKIITEKFLNKATVKSLIIRSWNLRGEVSMSDLADNTFLFNFAAEEDFLRIQKDSPWTVLCFLMVLKR